MSADCGVRADRLLGDPSKGASLGESSVGTWQQTNRSTEPKITPTDALTKMP